jgi:hypothetical protein
MLKTIQRSTKLTRKLNHLLDLKQKQASLDEAASSSKEAKNTAILNRTVLVFTAVTVLFVSDIPSLCSRVEQVFTPDMPIVDTPLLHNLALRSRAV